MADNKEASRSQKVYGPESEPWNSPLKSIKTDRHCTDVYCAVIFLLLSLCMWCLAGYSFQSGFPGRLQRGSDVYGNLCGYGALESKPYTYFPAPLRSTKISICLPGCPANEVAESICSYDETLQEDLEYECFDSYPSKPFFNFYCLPASRALRMPVFDKLYSADFVMTRVAWGLLAIASLITGGALVLYFLSMHIPCKFYSVLLLGLYYLSIGVLVFLMAVLCYLIYDESWRVDAKICNSYPPVMMEDCHEGDITVGYRYLCWVTVAIASVVCCVIACFTKRQRSGITLLVHISKTTKNLHLYCYAIIVLIEGTGVYVFFITFLIYQVSCGSESTNALDTSLYERPITEWQFDPAERVLVFFTVGMTLWYLSFCAHYLEFMTASIAAQSLLNKDKSPKQQFFTAMSHLVKYQAGSVLVASVLIPVGRLFRALFLGLRRGSKYVKGEAVADRCLGFCGFFSYFQYMTSNGIAILAITGEPFWKSARRGFHLVKRHEEQRIDTILNDANSIIWMFQLVLSLISPVFILYWVQHESTVFQDASSEEVTSVVSMAIYGLFFSWFAAQLYGSVSRGTLHGAVVSYLIDLEANEGERLSNSEMQKFMGEESNSRTLVEMPMNRVTPEPTKPKTPVSKSETAKPAEATPSKSKVLDYVTPGEESLPLKAVDVKAPDEELVPDFQGDVAPPPSRGNPWIVADVSQNLGEDEELLEKKEPVRPDSQS